MSITIATYNLRSRSFTETGEDVGDRSWDVRLPLAALQVLRTGASLLALQEVDLSPVPSQSAELRDELTALTGNAWQVVNANANNGGTGNPGAYLYDTTVVTHIEGGGLSYSELIDPSFAATRWCTWAKFSAVGEADPFWVLRCHMPTVSAVPSGQLPAMYAQCSSIVAARANVLLGGGERVVVLGDFNHYEMPQAGLTAAGLVDVRTRVPGMGNGVLRTYTAWDATMAGRQDGQQIDGIFLTAGWEANAASVVAHFADGVGLPLATPLASDHLPVVAELEQVPLQAEDVTPAPPPGVTVAHDTRPAMMCGEVVTGRITGRRLPVSAGSWSVGLNTAGSVEATIPLHGLSPAERVGLVGALEPWRCFLGVYAGDRVVEAGPVVALEYDDSTGLLRVAARGIEHIFSRRTVLRAGSVIDAMDGTIDDGISVRRSTIEVDNASLGTIAKRLIQNSMAMPGGALPLVLPVDQSGSESRVYYGYDMPNLAQEIDALRSVHGGPDFAFEPQFTSDGRVQWVMRAGTNADPLLHQNGDPWVWDPSTVRGATAGISVSANTSARANMAWASGEGQQYSLPQSVQVRPSDHDAGYPLLEAVDSYGDTRQLVALRGHARAVLEQGKRPWSTMSSTVQILDSPTWGEFRPGDWCRVIVPSGHPWLPAGPMAARLGSARGEIGTEFARLTFMATMGDR